MSGSILVALDLAHADEQKSILLQAARIASLDNSKISLITVVPDYDMSIVGSYFHEDAIREILEDANIKLHDLANDVLGYDNQARCLVSKGNAYEEILLAAERLGVSMIVMGAHKPSFKDYLLGPNAARVMRHAACSVLVVREPD